MPTIETALVITFGAVLLFCLYLGGREMGQIAHFSLQAKTFAAVALVAFIALIASLAGEEESHTVMSRLIVFSVVFAVYLVPTLIGLLRGERGKAASPRPDAE